MHVFSSIMYFPSPCEMHPTGHSAAHAPQDIHLSDILYAILNSPPFHKSLWAMALRFLIIFNIKLISKLFVVFFIHFL